MCNRNAKIFIFSSQFFYIKRYIEKQSSIRSKMEIKNIEMFEEKTSCKYTANNHKINAKVKEVSFNILSAVFSLKTEYTVQRIIPPPSRTLTGYKFISANDKLHKEKKVNLSLNLNTGAAKIAKNAKLNITPPPQTKDSLK